MSSSVEVICGEEKVTWSELTSALIAWGARNRILLKEGIKELPILFRFVEKRNKGSMSEILLRYMHEARNSKSTNPRDEIYALIGIAADAAAGNLPFRPDWPSEGPKRNVVRGTAIISLTSFEVVL